MGSSVARLSPTYLFCELKLHTGVWRGTEGSGPPFTTSPTDTVSFRAMNTDFLALDNPSGSRNADRFSSTHLPRPQRAHREKSAGKKSASYASSNPTTGHPPPLEKDWLGKRREILQPWGITGPRTLTVMHGMTQTSDGSLLIQSHTISLRTELQGRTAVGQRNTHRLSSVMVP